MTTRATAHDATGTNVASCLLTASGAVLAIAGGIWWAWDADPSTGKALLLAAAAVVGAAYWTTRRPRRLPTWGVVVAAVLVLLMAAYAIWTAIGTIVTQSTFYVG